MQYEWAKDIYIFCLEYSLGGGGNHTNGSTFNKMSGHNVQAFYINLSVFIYRAFS